VISFAERQAPEAVLSDWASDMGKLMNLMEGTCHLINRENMVHKI
jgi:26S proteasome regulatory subunit N5